MWKSNFRCPLSLELHLLDGVRLISTRRRTPGGFVAFASARSTVSTKAASCLDQVSKSDASTETTWSCFAEPGYAAQTFDACARQMDTYCAKASSLRSRMRCVAQSKKVSSLFQSRCFEKSLNPTTRRFACCLPKASRSSCGRSRRRRKAASSTVTFRASPSLRLARRSCS